MGVKNRIIPRQAARTEIRNETMDGETFKKVFNGEAVPDKVVGADLMSELQKDLNEKIGAPAKPESAEPEQSENK